MRGIDRFYRLETASALQTFDSVSRMAPGDPRGPFFKSTVHFSQYLLTHDRASYDAFIQESDRVIDICEGLIDNNEHDAVAKFYLGGINGYRGMLHQAEGSYLKAVSEGRQAYNLLEEAVAEDPQLSDAQMGFGLFRYLVAKAPKSLRFVLQLLGITPDLEGGLQSLRVAADKGVYTRNEARIYLSQFLFNEHRFDEAYRYLSDLRTAYPENPLFAVLEANWMMRQGRYEAAESVLVPIMRKPKASQPRYVSELTASTMGAVAFAMNDFAASRRYYESYIDSVTDVQRITNWMLYRFGVSCEVTGDRAKAVALYERMRDNEDAFRPFDAYYYRRGQELLEHPLRDVDISLIRAGNNMNGKKFSAAGVDYSRAAALASDNIDLLGQSLLGLLQAQFELGRYDEAEATAAELLRLQPPKETWVLPQGYFKLGQLYVKVGRFADARRAFEKVADFDDYDFQSQLEGRVAEELKKLEGR
jgi:tetratricopeptide (TPR) repeat protein